MQLEIPQRNIVITTTAVALIITTFGLLWLRRRKNSKPTANKKLTEQMIPTDWVQIGTVSSLHIYPVKSGRVVNLTKATAKEMGLEEVCRKGRLALRDRVFIVYREDDKTFLSSKTYNKLMKLTVNSLGNDTVELSFDNDKIIMKVPEGNKQEIVDMRTERMPAVDCGDDVGSWITKQLLGKEKGLRIGYWPESSKRDITDIYGYMMKFYENMSNECIGAFADLSSYLLVNQSSVDDLNKKINSNQNRVTPINFRPNIVIEGADPYSEDSWDWIKIGEEAIFRTFKPATRCTVVNINPETSERNAENEPLKTLKSYRIVKDEEQKVVEGEDPMMGMYMGLHSRGTIKCKDPVYIGRNS